MRKNRHEAALINLDKNFILGQEIIKHSSAKVIECEVLRFADSEVKVNVKETVRGRNVYIIQSTGFPANEKYMELLIAIDACKRASANTVNVLMPYYGYSRQERKSTSRDPITAKLIANILEAAGADRVITMDLHATQVQGFFDIPVDNFQAFPLIIEHFEKTCENFDNTVVVSPDHGGVVRARKLAQTLGTPLAIIDKRREKANHAEIMNVIGDVKGKKCILIDDMIDTGGTIVKGADALLALGATEIHVACSHAVFSNGAEVRLQESSITSIVTTNSLNISNLENCPKIKVLNAGDLFATAVEYINEDMSVSELFTTKYLTID